MVGRGVRVSNEHNASQNFKIRHNINIYAHSIYGHHKIHAWMGIITKIRRKNRTKSATRVKADHARLNSLLSSCNNTLSLSFR